MSIKFRSWTASTLAFASLQALAQAPGAPAQAGVTATRIPAYESVLSGYTAFKEEKPANWRDVNDTMGALGGHNAHLREVASSVSAAGSVLIVDRAAGRVRIASDAVKTLGWPAGIADWPLKSPALADQVTAGDRVSYTLEQDGDVYRIAGFGRDAPPAPAPAEPANPHAGHTMATPQAAPQAAQPAAKGAPHDMKNMKGMR